MGRGMFKVAAATALFALVHSALASYPAKAWVVGLLGSPGHALYRPFYVVQSLLLLAVLIVYIRRQHGQGPASAGDETMLATGLFAYTRHPLNWLLLPLFWLNPRMTSRLLAFTIVVSLYVVIGSVHLEQHLLAAYGEAYRHYQEQVPFFLGLGSW